MGSKDIKKKRIIFSLNKIMIIIYSTIKLFYYYYTYTISKKFQNALYTYKLIIKRFQTF